MDHQGLNGQVCGHFGQAPTYTIYDSETEKVRVVDNRSQHMGGVGLPPEHLHREGVNIMLCSGLGPKAVSMFESFGIEVYVGANSTVRQSLELFLQGKLPLATMDNACKDHHH